MNFNAGRRRLLIIGAGLGLSALVPALVAHPQDRVIRVSARRFAFTPSEIHLVRGVPVTLELTSSDVVMGFNAPDFGVRSDILPGTLSRLRLNPDKSGNFLFHCDIFCGSGHEEMNGTLIVT
jgi:cytochrome c oxidase subunit II